MILTAKLSARQTNDVIIIINIIIANINNRIPFSRLCATGLPMNYGIHGPFLILLGIIIIIIIIITYIIYILSSCFRLYSRFAFAGVAAAVSGLGSR